VTNPWAPLANLWEQRTMRERVMIAGLLTAVAVFLIHLLLYQPLRARHDEAMQRFAAAERDHLWLQKRAQKITGMQASMRGARLAGIPPGKLRDILADSLKKNGLKAKLGVIDQEEGTKQIEVSFPPADGKTVMRWIEGRVNDGHLLQRLHIETADKGQVSAKAWFER